MCPIQTPKFNLIGGWSLAFTVAAAKFWLVEKLLIQTLFKLYTNPYSIQKWLRSTNSNQIQVGSGSHFVPVPSPSVIPKMAQVHITPPYCQSLNIYLVNVRPEPFFLYGIFNDWLELLHLVYKNETIKKNLCPFILLLKC